MARLLFISVSVLLSFLNGSSTQGQDATSVKRLHFTLVRGDETAKLLPVDAAAPIGEGETRVSCREVEFCIKYNKPRTILVDGRIEHIDSWLEGERIEIEYGRDGLEFSGLGLKRHFRNAVAEGTFKEHLRLNNAQLLRDSIDRGMIESEKEHPKFVLQQLRRTFITGQGYVTK